MVCGSEKMERRRWEELFTFYILQHVAVDANNITLKQFTISQFIHGKYYTFIICNVIFWR